VAPNDVLADRLAIADLVTDYARAVDRRRIDDVVAMFTENGRLAIFDGSSGDAPPRQERLGREAIAKAMRVLGAFDTTTHFVGQHTATIDGDRAEGETYCLAHHLRGAPPERTVMIMSIRYLDRFVRTAGGWRIEDRVLVVDWEETRTLG
jgi:hypothetical protein